MEITSQPDGIAGLVAVAPVSIRGGTLELRAENLQGECGDADSDTLELLSDGTLLYVSKGDGWEARGALQRAS